MKVELEEIIDLLKDEAQALRDVAREDGNNEDYENAFIGNSQADGVIVAIELLKREFGDEEIE